jgi:glycine/D-amino acid oxidase-like deaminating enzyme
MATDADSVVIGAGISGLTTAYGLMRRGRSVAVLDAGRHARFAIAPNGYRAAALPSFTSRTIC